MLLISDKLQQVRLTLSRLNDMWSFTGQPLSYQVDLLLRIAPEEDWENILYAVRGYAALTRAAGLQLERGATIPDEWLRMYKTCGQALMFDLPENLKYFQRKRFDKALGKHFLFGLGQGESPLPP